MKNFKRTIATIVTMLFFLLLCSVVDQVKSEIEEKVAAIETMVDMPRMMVEGGEDGTPTAQITPQY